MKDWILQNTQRAYSDDDELGKIQLVYARTLGSKTITNSIRLSSDKYGTIVIDNKEKRLR